jgi:hypothetical protein
MSDYLARRPYVSHVCPECARRYGLMTVEVGVTTGSCEICDRPKRLIVQHTALPLISIMAIQLGGRRDRNSSDKTEGG